MGYPESESTWEPLSHLKYILDLVEEFDKQFNNTHKENNHNNFQIKKVDENKENKNKDNLLGKKRNSIKDKAKEIKNEKKNSIEGEKIIIDRSIKKVISVRLDKNLIVAVVEKVEKNGKIIKEMMSTKDLRRINPFILIEYYEGKVKFA